MHRYLNTSVLPFQYCQYYYDRVVVPYKTSLRCWGVIYMYNKGHVPKTARVDHSWKLTCSVVGNNAKYL